MFDVSSCDELAGNVLATGELLSDVGDPFISPLPQLRVLSIFAIELLLDEVAVPAPISGFELFAVIVSDSVHGFAGEGQQAASVGEDRAVGLSFVVCRARCLVAL